MEKVNWFALDGLREVRARLSAWTVKPAPFRLQTIS